MYNPFPLLNAGMLQEQIAKGKRWFVRQRYARGGVGAFLLRAYTDGEKEQAELHMQALSRDRHAFLYDADLAEHRQRLELAAGQPEGYRVYYAVKKGKDWTPPDVYQGKIRGYIWKHHPDWRAPAKIEVGLEEEFGELFLVLSCKNEEETIPLETIENY